MTKTLTKSRSVGVSGKPTRKAKKRKARSEKVKSDVIRNLMPDPVLLVGEDEEDYQV